MANHVSALKRARQTVTRTDRNRAGTSKLRSALRGLREAIAGGDQKAAHAAYGVTASAIDKAAKTGMLHKNTASRYKSRLSVRVNKLAKKSK